MSEIALDAVKAIRERLSQIIADLDRMENALRNTPLEAIEDADSPKDALNELPWTPYKSGKGAWIFSNLADPRANQLREVLTRNKGTIELYGVKYRFSGPDQKFISRYS
jgi:hypothetical protein